MLLIENLIIKGEFEKVNQELIRILKGSSDVRSKYGFNLSPHQEFELIYLITQYQSNKKSFTNAIITYEQFKSLENRWLAKLLEFINYFKSNSSTKYPSNNITSESLSYFCSFEDLGYGFSIIYNDIDDNLFFKRITAFASIIESLILSDSIVSDLRNTKIDIEIKNILSHYNLNEFFIVDYEGIDLDLAGFGGQTIEYLFPEDLIKEKDEVSAINQLSTLDYNELIGRLGLFWRNFDKGSILKNFSEIIDYMHFLYIETNENDTEIFQILKYFNEGKLTISNLKDSKLNSFLDLLIAVTFALINSEIALLNNDNLKWNPLNFKSSLILDSPFFAPSSKVFINKTQTKRDVDLNILNDFIFNNYNELINFPLLFSYILSKAENIKEIFDISLEVKNSKELRFYRKWCSELDYYIKNGNFINAKKMIQYAENEISNISKKYHSPLIETQLSFPPNIIFSDNIQKGNIRNNNLFFLKKLYNDTLTPFLLKDKIKRIFNR